MSHLVFCTFDLKDASSQDYKDAYKDLEEIGLTRVVEGKKRDVVIPTTSVLGEFNTSDTATLRDNVREKIKTAFNNRGFDSEIFIIVSGSSWTWGSATT